MSMTWGASSARPYIEAMQMMCEGDKWELFIPYDLAYGERGSMPKIPPFSPLVFEMEIHKVGPHTRESPFQVRGVEAPEAFAHPSLEVVITRLRPSWYSLFFRWSMFLTMVAFTFQLNFSIFDAQV